MLCVFSFCSYLQLLRRTCCHSKLLFHTIPQKHVEESYLRRRQRTFLSSKDIRKHFIDYFVSDKSHLYIHSSPVFLNNDPTLLFVNAGMNQFKSLLLDDVPHSHEFHNLKRAVNSQKCIRISGKHNDLDQVGHDFHHHTFFEMLGNWSFGNYFKKEACEMAWELLTKVYGLPEKQLYITYFGGDEKLQLPADEECRNIWLDIGVSEDHIFPFGAKDNFWDMGDIGPCGPCTEIHYDYLGDTNNTLPAAQRLNAGRPDLIEIWNLVFTQYKREQSGKIEKLLKHNVDTGMGLERLTAVLQKTTSNYDTDIFVPLFDAIQNNFNVRPYTGLLGAHDVDGIDTAYRIIADHSRMFTVAISDGIFPDSYDAGHILRKIIRKAAYAANSIMKTRPGHLSTLVPYVVESLDFFPELEKHAKEVMDIVNDEEKMLHQVINRGRKVRNKMVSENKDSFLNGKNIWELQNIYGLDEKIINDLSSEMGLKLDLSGYQKIVDEEEKKSTSNLGIGEKSIVNSAVLQLLKSKNIVPTICSQDKKSRNLTSKIVAIVQNDLLVDEVMGHQNFMLITTETNFNPHSANQISDIGNILNEDFHFTVDNVTDADGYVFHRGRATKGNIKMGSEVTLSVDEIHRNKCVTNHTATHLVHAALRQILPYTPRISTFANANDLQVGYSAKAALNLKQIEQMEIFVNNAIKVQLLIKEVNMPFGKILTLPSVAINRGQNYPDVIKAVILGEDKLPEIIEPCQQLHLDFVADICKFVIVNSKSTGGTSRMIHAVTGDKAKSVISSGAKFQQQVKTLEDILARSQNMEKYELIPVLKDVKKLLHECNSSSNMPWVVLRNCEVALKEMKYKLLSLLNLTGTIKEPHYKILNEIPPSRVSTSMKKYLTDRSIQPTRNVSEYKDYIHDHHYNVKPMYSDIAVIFQNYIPVEMCETNQHCVVVTTKSNFYATNYNEIGDKGTLSNKDCCFTVTDTYQEDGYIFHEGWVQKGVLNVHQNVKMEIDKNHRKECSVNNTASHLLHSALQKTLTFVVPSDVTVKSSDLQLNFQSNIPLSPNLLQEIENLVNKCIQQKLEVTRSELPFSQVKGLSNYSSSFDLTHESDPVPVITIGHEDSALYSQKPCYGIHACNTSDLENFVLISSKVINNMEKIIRAVSGRRAKEVLENGKLYDDETSEFTSKVEKCLNNTENDNLELWDLLKEIKIIKNRHETDLPVISFRKHQDRLTELAIKLNKCTNSFVQEGFNQIKREMKEVLELHGNSHYIIHKLNSLGDGKRIVNYALKSVANRPCIFFAADGHKTVICSCVVPQEYVTPSFSALLWIQPVATYMEGRARFQSNNSELSYSIESNHVDRIDKALEIAKQFVESYL